LQVKERTGELTELVGELEAFSYSLTHDLREPLRAMQGFARLLELECAGQLSGDGQEYISRIVTAAYRMDRLVQDALNYSVIARKEFELTAINLDEFLRGILETYPSFQPPRAEVLLEGSFPQVLGNEAAFTQCISNLLGNAIKFVAPGVTPIVHIRAERTSDRVRLSFRDNGIGIAPKQHGRIFDIFQRLNQDYEGTGIGLAIVKKAVERMGGKVGVESQPGQGSTFWLELRSVP
jgi:signal transduction histidine kinase